MPVQDQVECGKLLVPEPHNERPDSSASKTPKELKPGTEMRLIEENFDENERNEAHEIMSEMRDHVGAIDDESEVRSFQTFQKTVTSGEFTTTFKANLARKQITSENFKAFS